MFLCNSAASATTTGSGQQLSASNFTKHPQTLSKDDVSPVTMNPTLKHWKEAATLILAAGRRLVPTGLSSKTPEPALSVSPLSGSCARSQLPHASAFDYHVLLLKRSGRSGFMPNAYVFPGGKVDAADFSSEWLDVFESFRDSSSFGLRRVTQPVGTRPPIFATDRLKLGSPVPGEVAFRICALRETFEESGILLVVSNPEDKVLLLKDTEDVGASGIVSGVCSSELSRWRSLVIQNPSNFLRMCRELQLLPNIWALHEWSNWLTPVARYGATRFDTAFFICCLQETPQTLQDQIEIEHFQWSTPSEVLQSFQAQEFWIAPPQFYELSRMCRFPSLSDLHTFSSQRASKGCEQWLPIVVPEDDHYISVLPGDKLYPQETSEQTRVDQSTDRPEEPQNTSALHRMEIKNPHSIDLQITITPKNSHLMPVLQSSHDVDSRL